MFARFAEPPSRIGRFSSVKNVPLYSPTSPCRAASNRTWCRKLGCVPRVCPRKWCKKRSSAGSRTLAHELWALKRKGAMFSQCYGDIRPGCKGTAKTLYYTSHFEESDGNLDAP